MQLGQCHSQPLETQNEAHMSLLWQSVVPDHPPRHHLQGSVLQKRHWLPAHTAYMQVGPRQRAKERHRAHPSPNLGPHGPWPCTTAHTAAQLLQQASPEEGMPIYTRDDTEDESYRFT